VTALILSTALRRVLFCRQRFTAELARGDLAPLLAGWEIAACPPGKVADHLDGIDAVCPFGAPIDAAVLAAGGFGLVHQYGVGLEKVGVARATELGVWVCRVPGDAGANADSVAEIAVRSPGGCPRRRRRWPADVSIHLSAARLAELR
jgi:hypothetical protein